LAAVFARAGKVFGAIRDQELMRTSTPFSSASTPRYAPHSQVRIAISTGFGSGLTLSAL
jgi:hypothetical protein